MIQMDPTAALQDLYLATRGGELDEQLIQRNWPMRSSVVVCRCCRAVALEECVRPPIDLIHFALGSGSEANTAHPKGDETESQPLQSAERLSIDSPGGKRHAYIKAGADARARETQLHSSDEHHPEKIAEALDGDRGRRRVEI